MKHLLVIGLMATVVYVTDNGLQSANKGALYNISKPAYKQVFKRYKQAKNTPKLGLSGPMFRMLRASGYNY